MTYKFTCLLKFTYLFIRVPASHLYPQNLTRNKGLKVQVKVTFTTLGVGGWPACDLDLQITWWFSLLSPRLPSEQCCYNYECSRYRTTNGIHTLMSTHMAINSNLYVDLTVALTSNRKVKHVLPQIKHKKALGMKPSRGLMKKKIMSIIGRQ